MNKTAATYARGSSHQSCCDWGLETQRDLAAEGQIAAAPVYSPVVSIVGPGRSRTNPSYANRREVGALIK